MDDFDDLIEDACEMEFEAAADAAHSQMPAPAADMPPPEDFPAVPPTTAQNALQAPLLTAVPPTSQAAQPGEVTRPAVLASQTVESSQQSTFRSRPRLVGCHFSLSARHLQHEHESMQLLALSLRSLAHSMHQSH